MSDSDACASTSATWLRTAASSSVNRIFSWDAARCASWSRAMSVCASSSCCWRSATARSRFRTVAARSLKASSRVVRAAWRASAMVPAAASKRCNFRAWVVKSSLDLRFTTMRSRCAAKACICCCIAVTCASPNDRSAAAASAGRAATRCNSAAAKRQRTVARSMSSVAASISYRMSIFFCTASSYIFSRWISKSYTARVMLMRSLLVLTLTCASLPPDGYARGRGGSCSCRGGCGRERYADADDDDADGAAGSAPGLLMVDSSLNEILIVVVSKFSAVVL